MKYNDHPAHPSVYKGRSAVPVKSFMMLFAILGSYLLQGQITSDKEALETLDWLVDHPQVASDSLFNTKFVDLLKWQSLHHPKTPMKSKGIGEFMGQCEDHPFYQEVIVIYMFSEFRNTILGKHYDEVESAFIAISRVLRYYKNLVMIDNTLTNDLLEGYARMPETELRDKMRTLVQ